MSFCWVFGAQKEYRCYNPSTRKYDVFADVIFFEFVPYFSSNNPGILLAPVPLPQYIRLSSPKPIPDATTPRSQLECTKQPAPNPLRCSLNVQRFMPLHLPWMTPIQLQVHLLSSVCLLLTLMFLLLFKKVNGFVLIILFIILSFMTVLPHPFASLSSLCLLYLYSGLMRMLYWYLPGSRS